MKLKGRAAIVTGASLGIGLALAEALVARGARVAGFARDAARLRKVERRIGEGFVPVACDVGDLGQVRKAVRAARKALGGIDILVNNAGIGRFGLVEKLAKADWDEMLATNLSGAFHCTREVVPLMKAKGRGHIVNIGSIAGLVAYPGASGYNATKFALRGMSESLRQELAGHGIKVSAVYPGVVDTTFGRGSQGAGLRPEEVAEAVLHLLEQSGRMLVSDIVLRPFKGR